MSINIELVRTDSDLRRFVRCPFELYRKSDQWVPPLIRNQLKTVFETAEEWAVGSQVTRVGQLVLKRSGLKIVDVKDKKDFLPYSTQVFDLLNDAYSNLYGAVELTPKQIETYSREFFDFIDPRFNKVIVDADGRLVAVGLTFPCLAEALRKARGRLLPAGFVHLKRAAKNPKRLNLGLVAVRPECQGRGVPAILMTEITRAALENGIISADTGRELEDNLQVRSLWKSFNARQCKRRRVYYKALA